MKLVHQINLAFAVSMMLVLSITAVMIHYVLLDHFIGVEQAELRTLGASMTARLTTQPVVSMEAAAPVAAVQAPLPISAVTREVAAIVTDQQGNIVSGKVPALAASSGIIKAGMAPQATSIQSIWSGEDSRFLVQINTIPQGKLTLLSPVSKIRTIEQALLKRMILVFAAGATLMLLFSLFITRKLINPLIRLREELKKVKSRHFSEVGLIKAGGEIGTVAETVYEMAGELNRFNRVQKQFFQNASHELKSPLMSISGYAEGIRDGVFEGEGIVKGLNVILGETSRLRNLVTEMTLLAKLDSEEDIYRPAEVSLQELLEDALERINPLLAKRKLALHTAYSGGPLIVTADRDKLLQALLNVLNNAARYAGGSIEIQTARTRGRITLHVADDGPGIPEELLPALFHRFVKGKDGESGLGLAISRAIVERGGGRIQADNRKTGGALISLEFPAANSA
ncbi:HAMP domain-containing histidine kinase [Paenibacillus albidus]|uniref:sensor histidine kinase n=1 Tax=Paenibacillus albidus TaxID=2041023 RepID=UPI001BE63AD5|nr:HAMP domain-containing sensor histidine kinase [Paenibacillus albidus]MBT2290696.1 HAMP domain-containing histidine kinase [Paenibacillus albidus]